MAGEHDSFEKPFAFAMTQDKAISCADKPGAQSFALPSVQGGQPQPILSVRNVGKIYHIYDKPADRLRQAWWGSSKRFYREFAALDDITLDLLPGEACGIIGRNGSGKSTLLQIIAGTLQPTHGQVRVRGRVAALLELGSGFNPEFSGRENVFLNGAILGLTREQVAQRFDEIAAFADIGAFIDQPVKTYSTGMVVRLAFAVQVLLQPDLLIVDEALAVGDASFQRKCYQRLERLREEGVALLFVSHGLDLVRTICSTALYLEAGRTKGQGDAAEVCDQYFQDLLNEQVHAEPAVTHAAAADNAAEPVAVLDRYMAGQTAEATLQGSMDLEITEATLHTTGERPYLLEGDTLLVSLSLRVQRPVSHFMFGLMLRDKVGTEICGFSCYDHELGISQALRPGDTLQLEINVEMAIRSDHYFVTLGLQSPGFNDVYFYGHDLLKFKLEAPPLRDPLIVGGIARLRHDVKAALRRDTLREQTG